MRTTRIPKLTHPERRARKLALLADLKAGLSIPKAARRHKLARMTLLAYAKEAGIDIKATGDDKAPRGLLIIADYLAGKPASQIAKDRRLTVSQVNLWIRSALMLEVVREV